MRQLLLLPLAIMLIAAAPVDPLPAPNGKETAIPFVSRDGIRDFKANGRVGVWIEGGNGQYYYARTMGECPRLPAADTIGFRTSAADQLDRFGQLIVEGSICPVASVVKSDPPPGSWRAKQAAKRRD